MMKCLDLFNSPEEAAGSSVNVASTFSIGGTPAIPGPGDVTYPVPTRKCPSVRRLPLSGAVPDSLCSPRAFPSL